MQRREGKPLSRNERPIVVFPRARAAGRNLPGSSPAKGDVDLPTASVVTAAVLPKPPIQSPLPTSNPAATRIVGGETGAAGKHPTRPAV